MHNRANRHRRDRRRGHHSTMPLSMASAGETVKLVKIHSGRALRKRLADLGLNIGMTVRVVQGNHRGPMILAVKEDTRLALGRGMAHKIDVASCKSESNNGHHD